MRYFTAALQDDAASTRTPLASLSEQIVSFRQPRTLLGSWPESRRGGILFAREAEVGHGLHVRGLAGKMVDAGIPIALDWVVVWATAVLSALDPVALAIL